MSSLLRSLDSNFEWQTSGSIIKLILCAQITSADIKFLSRLIKFHLFFLNLLEDTNKRKHFIISVKVLLNSTVVAEYIPYVTVCSTSTTSHQSNFGINYSPYCIRISTLQTSVKEQDRPWLHEMEFISISGVKATMR